MSTPLDWSATEIARRIAMREISAREVVQAFISRIEAVNPALNAVVLPRFDDALAEAAAADERQARGEPLGPLHGVPMTFKECFLVAGMRSTIGLTSERFQRPVERDGILTERLRRAGVILLGKTNLPQLMIWHGTDNPVYGATANPWNAERTPGGSTGGEAAIIAAGGSPLGLGNDMGGSIRVPCHFCGIHGLKPTSHRLPRTGSVSTLRGFDAIITQPGPMGRHVADLALELRVLMEPDDYVTSDAAPAKLGDPNAVPIDKLKIAFWTDDGVFPASPAIRRAVREGAAALAARGAEMIEFSADEVNRVFHTNEALDLYLGLLGADGGAGFRGLAKGSTRDWRVKRLLWLAGMSWPLRAALVGGLSLAGQHWQARLVQHARGRSAQSFWKLVQRKHAIDSEAVAALRQRGISAVVCPPHALPAPLATQGLDLIPAASYAYLFNLLSWPAGVVAATRVRPGEDDERAAPSDIALRQARVADTGSVGLPVGVQVGALPWREDVVLAVMGALEESFRRGADYPSLHVPTAVK
jgi:fatty acid amide hydrolase